MYYRRGSSRGTRKIKPYRYLHSGASPRGSSTRTYRTGSQERTVCWWWIRLRKPKWGMATRWLRPNRDKLRSSRNGEYNHTNEINQSANPAGLDPRPLFIYWRETDAATGRRILTATARDQKKAPREDRQNIQYNSHNRWKIRAAQGLWSNISRATYKSSVWEVTVLAIASHAIDILLERLMGLFWLR
jgi:hypothetical protein